MIGENEYFLEEENVVILTDENGKENKFEFLDLISLNDKDYVVLLPDDDSGEVVILEYQELSDSEEAYVSVDDEDILDAVFKIFKKRAADLFNFED